MITITDSDGRKHSVARSEISRVSERAGISSMRYSSIVHLKEGSHIYVEETHKQVMDMIYADAAARREE